MASTYWFAYEGLWWETGTIINKCVCVHSELYKRRAIAMILLQYDCRCCHLVTVLYGFDTRSEWVD